MKGVTVAVIPARFASTRFPGKPLVMIGDRTMIQRVYDQVSQAASVDQVIVATDNVAIFDHVSAFGGQVMMTSEDHLSGTDRCAEVAAQLPDADWIINVQGDEPFIHPQQIDLLVHTLKDSVCGIATLAKLITENAVLINENVVKVAVGKTMEALYFSRHPIPFIRGEHVTAWLKQGIHYKHIGLYGFQAAVLASIAALPPGILERAESLEQLRWLENGFRIAVGITELETIGIDTPEDLLNH
jgi:3-deoxy-manno-octulosonate cytidylyltransferase (CMP-KDO synthetase)